MRAIEKGFRWDNEGQPYVFDPSRSKWLSVARLWCGASRNGSITVGQYLRYFNGTQYTATRVFQVPKDGTLLYLSIHSDTTPNDGAIQIHVNGSSVYQLDYNDATDVYVTNINVDFSAGDKITVYAVYDTTTYYYPMVKYWYAWRL